MRRLRGRLTFANVVSVLALFVALGGTAGAAVIITSNSQVGPDTISGHKPPSGDHSNIISGSVGGADLGNGSVSNGKLQANAVTGGKVKDNDLTGADISEATLGPVPNANALGGIDATGFVQGTARVYPIDAGDANGATLATVPGFIQVEGICGGTQDTGAISFETFDQPVTIISDNGGADPTRHDVGSHTSTGTSDWNLNPKGDHISFSVSGGGEEATVDIFSYTFFSSFLHVDICRWEGQAIVNRD